MKTYLIVSSIMASMFILTGCSYQKTSLPDVHSGSMNIQPTIMPTNHSQNDQ